MNFEQLTRKVDLNSLRLFEVVCRLGSFAGAARREPLTPSAISKRIADLEEALGLTLLSREHSGVRVTREGEVLLAQWRKVAESLRHLLQATHGETSSQQEGFRLVADGIAGSFLRLDRLGQRNQYASRSVYVQVVQGEEVAAAVVAQRADAGVWVAEASSNRDTTLTWTDGGRLQEFRFLAEVCVAVLNAEHPLVQQAGSETAQDYGRHRWICAAGTHRHLERIQNDSIGPSPWQAFETARPDWSHHSISALEHLAANKSADVVVLPTSARRVLHRYPELTCLPLPGSMGYARFGCLLRAGRTMEADLELMESVVGSSLHRVSALQSLA